MIIPVINQKLLMVDTSQAESKRVTDILEMNHIEYYIKTQATSGSFATSRMTDARAAARMGYHTAIDSVDGGYVYSIYVKRRDYSRAKELITKN